GDGDLALVGLGQRADAVLQRRISAKDTKDTKKDRNRRPQHRRPPPCLFFLRVLRALRGWLLTPRRTSAAACRGSACCRRSRPRRSARSTGLPPTSRAAPRS